MSLNLGVTIKKECVKGSGLVPSGSEIRKGSLLIPSIDSLYPFSLSKCQSNWKKKYWGCFKVNVRYIEKSFSWYLELKKKQQTNPKQNKSPSAPGP